MISRTFESLLVCAAVLGLAEFAIADAVMTESGAPLKVIAHKHTSLYEKPDAASRNRPVRQFQFFYVLSATDAADGLKKGFYRVGIGTTEREASGWLKQSDVILWPHREALGFRPVAGRKLAEFYRSREELQQALAGTSLTPLSREPKGGGQVRLLPILSRFTMKLDGDDVDSFQVAYLHSTSGSRATETVSNSSGVDLSQATLDVVFVIDTTGSMNPYIEATRRVIDVIAQRLSTSGEGAAIRFGLVGYRDVGEADSYVTRLFCNLDVGQSLPKFQSVLNDVSAGGGGDTQEDVMAGIKCAVRDSRWNPNAFKHLIVIGDASAHLESTGDKNSEKLTLKGAVEMAQPHGREAVKSRIVMHTVRIVRTDDAEDQRQLEFQFKTLANGADAPGKYFEFPASGGEPKFVDSLVETILRSREGLAAVVKGERPADTTPGLGQLLEMVGASTAESGGSEFTSGFVCETDNDGNLALEPYVLVQRSQLELFDSSLDFTVKLLSTSGKRGAQRTQDLVQQIQSSTLGVSLGEKISGQTSLKQILEMASGLPIRSDVFDITIERLAAMSGADYETWLRGLQSSRSTVRSRLETTQLWFSLDQDVPLERRFAFVRVQDLP